MFKIGDRVKLSRLGETQYASQAQGHSGSVTSATYDSGWSDVRWDNGHENNYEVEDLVLVEADATLKAEPKAAPTPRVKYLYSVQDKDGDAILYTHDREFARAYKALHGGKKEGVSIIPYVPLKEIR